VRVERRGCSRRVTLIGGVAIKVPTLSSWRLFLIGLLGNMLEATWWERTGGDHRLCDVLWCLPGGFVLVMRRALPVSDAQFGSVNKSDFEQFTGDLHAANFGWLGQRLVLVDYGQERVCQA
jgi:hypothetical protein